ncbi:MAG: hypothetical protein NTW21_40600, partial [Verrucomicrobia bacterium]|nr:hypothetical protein [Verrucomicrobiota bacterium]
MKESTTPTAVRHPGTILSEPASLQPDGSVVALEAKPGGPYRITAAAAIWRSFTFVASRLLVPARNLAGQQITALLAGAVLLAGVISSRAAAQTLTLQPGENYVTCQVTGANSNEIGDATFLSGQVPAGLELDFWSWSDCAPTAPDTLIEYDGANWVDTVTGDPVPHFLWKRDEVIRIVNPAVTAVTLTLNGAPLVTPVLKTLSPCCWYLLGSQVLGEDTFDNITGHPASDYAGVEVYRIVPNGLDDFPGSPAGSGGYTRHTYTAGGGWSPPFPTLNAGESVYIRVNHSTACVPLGLALWLPLDEATGTTAANLFAGGNPGTLNGTPAHDPTGFVAN